MHVSVVFNFILMCLQTTNVNVNVIVSMSVCSLTLKGDVCQRIKVCVAVTIVVFSAGRSDVIFAV